MSFYPRFKAAHSSLAAAGETFRSRHNVRDRFTTHTVSHRGSNGTRTGPAPFPLRQAPDAETRQLAKKYFKLIQAVHHKNVIDTAISTRTPPKGMHKHVIKLTQFIKPSSPNDTTRQALIQNTEKWMHNNLDILQNHYRNTITSFTDLPFVDLPFQIACGWARKRYQSRLAQSTLQATQSLLEHGPDLSHVSDSLSPSPRGSRGADASPPGLDLGDKQQFPPLPKPQRKWSDPRSLYLGNRTPLIEQTNRIHTRLHGGEGVGGGRPGPGLTTSPRPGLQPATRDQGARQAPLAARLMSPPPPLPLSPVVQVRSRTEAGALSVPQVHSHSSPPAPNHSSPLRQPPSPPLSPPRPPPPPRPLPSSSSSSPLPSAQTRPRQARTRARSPPESSSEDDFVDLGLHKSSVTHRKHRQERHNNGLNSSNKHILTDRNSSNTHHPFHSNVAVTDREPITEAPLLNPLLIPTGHTAAAAGSTSASRPEPNRKGDPPVVVGNKMMSMRLSKQKHANRMVHKASSDPTTNTNNPTELRSLASPPPSPSPSPSPSSSPSPSTHRPNRAGTMIRARDRSQPNTALYTPTYHKTRPGRKLTDWSLTGKKPIWFLGDSNLNRVPPHKHPDIQIDSYPGASLYHFWRLLERTPKHPHVEVVVLSVGINNRDQDPKKTSIKQLRMVFRRAQSAFPNATIHIPLINFSTLLPQDQQNNLTAINRFISDSFPSLGLLPARYFATCADGIHWTHSTAHHIFEHWCDLLQLNL